MDSMRTDSGCVSHARKTQNQKPVERWAKAYGLSTQESVNKPLTIRRLMQKCGGTFQHAPLNHLQQSIRLVYLLPDLSPEGLIRCIIFHASIESPYACLSYEWNRALHLRKDRHTGFDERIVLINDRPLLIRENLFDFLCTARHNATRSWPLDKIDLSTPLWIDAICIDQSNASEKIHQVKSMGDIYSSALTVHAWLGIATPPTEATGIPLLSASDYTKNFEIDMQDEMAKCFPNKQNDGQISYHITRNTYWKRAWVVQEICLAPKLIFWVHTVPVDEKFMQNIYVDSDWADIYEDHDFSQYRDTRFKKPARTSLLTTLHQFRNKQCADPRDRIFSLLSLCSAGASTIPVDYNIELDQLAYHVLRSHPGPICLCSVMSVARQLELLPTTDENKEPANNYGDITPWIDVDISETDLEKFLLDPYYLESAGLCASLQPIFHAATTGCLDLLWTTDESGYYLRGGNEKIYTIRIALRALGKVDDFRSSIVLCRTTFSAIDAAEAMVRLGRGQDGSDLQDLVTFDWRPILQEKMGKWSLF